MKIKQKVDFAIDLALIAVIILGVFGFSNVKLLLVTLFLVYALFNLVQYLLTSKFEDFEGFYTFLGSIIMSVISCFIDFNHVNNLTIIILSWVGVMSVIKFIKTDYYNDRKDKMWKIRIFTLVAFMVIGILTSISMNYVSSIQVLILGYFFFIHGILELVDPLTKYLIGK